MKFKDLCEALDALYELPEGPERTKMAREIEQQCKIWQAESISETLGREIRYSYPGKKLLRIERDGAEEDFGMTPEKIPFFIIQRSKDGKWILRIFQSYWVTKNGMGSSHSPPINLSWLAISLAPIGVTIALLIRSFL